MAVVIDWTPEALAAYWAWENLPEQKAWRARQNADMERLAAEAIVRQMGEFGWWEMPWTGIGQAPFLEFVDPAPHIPSYWEHVADPIDWESGHRRAS